jgi:hypothetical protein
VTEALPCARDDIRVCVDVVGRAHHPHDVHGVECRLILVERRDVIGDRLVQRQCLNTPVLTVQIDGVEEVRGAKDGEAQAAAEGWIGRAHGVADRMQTGSRTSSHAAYVGTVRSTVVNTSGCFSVRKRRSVAQVQAARSDRDAGICVERGAPS